MSQKNGHKSQLKSNMSQKNGHKSQLKSNMMPQDDDSGSVSKRNLWRCNSSE